VNNAISLIWLAIAVIGIIAGWKIFTKAGQPGWAYIIPIYSFIVLMRIIGRPWWWLLLMLVPLLNIVLIFIIAIDLAKSFGRSAAFGVGLVFLSFIFALILGFGSDTYRGPRGEDGGTMATADPNAAW
jgi:hypothetical protein